MSRSRSSIGLLCSVACAVFVSLSALQASAVARPDLAGAKPKPKPVLQGLVDQLVHDGAPGAFVVVRTPTGVRRAASGLAARSPKIKLRATDRWRIASLTKSFVATVVLQLVAEGKLSLDDTVERWLPGLVPNGSAITIRELLNHTSGLYDYSNDPGFATRLLNDPDYSWTPAELVAIATAHPPVFDPGRSWQYSNTGYVLLGMIVEAATGATIDEQLRDRLFEPLKLVSTTFPTTTLMPKASGHGYIGIALLPVRVGTLVDITSTMSPTWLGAAGGIVSNGDDVTRFYAALFRGRLVTPTLLRTMRTVSPPASNYGLGLFRYSLTCGTAYGHIGDAIGWRTVAYARADGRRVAVLMVNIDRTQVPWSELESFAEQAFCSR